MKKIQNYLLEQLEDFYSIGVCVFGLFFICESFNLNCLRSENVNLISEINDRAEEIRISNDEVLARTYAAGNFRFSLSLNNERAKPFLQLLESYQPENGNLSNFIKDMKSDLVEEGVKGFSNDLFLGLEKSIHLSEKYPELKNYAYSLASQEFALRLNSVMGVGSCSLFRDHLFIISEVIGDEYHFYPNNFQKPSIYRQIKINGEMLNDDYLWKPTRRGMHYFDIEYNDLSNFEVNKKRFRVGLKVI